MLSYNQVLYRLERGHMTGGSRLPNPILAFDGVDEKVAVDDFNRDGFYLHRGLFGSQDVTNAMTWLQTQNPKILMKSWTDQEPAVPLAVYSDAHLGNNPMAQLANSSKIFEMAGKLMDKPTYIRASKVNFKAPWCGTVEYYHQDFVYWKDRGYLKEEMLTCMIFLQKHNIRNAALHVFPGTHKLGFIPHQPFININGLSKRMVPPDTLDQLNKEHGLVTIEAEPGDALFFHVSLVHGSSHNISPDGRMVLLVQLNTFGNEPHDTSRNIKQFNVLRATAEVDEANRRFLFFKEKLKKQVKSESPEFCAPIPDQEK
ncbi:MAG: phytanoyl-CoA dioxygenase family protein [Verrucomicrobiota bacterium]|nr:phytanoyl-CoA dioxygenase family protein [Verrucomicrobiota bacterium]